MKKRDDVIWEKIALSLSNEELSETDKKDLDDWQENDVENRKLHDILNGIHLYSEDDALTDKEEILNLTYSKMFSIIPSENKSRKKSRFILLSIAASILLLLSFGTYLFLKNQNNGNVLSYYCAAGEHAKKVILPDDTEVILNSDSRLTFSKNSFSHHHRNVKLDGEAMFSVTHDKKHPFLVDVSVGQIKVLGTKFNVRSYPNEEKTEATLIEGSVEISSKETKEVIRIKPDEQASISRKNGSLSVAQVNVDDFIMWKDGWLQFQSMPLKEITRLLERHYNVKITIQNDNLNNALFTGRFNEDEGLENIISVIQLYCKYKYIIKNNEYFII